jgi:o-succinylbenzoate---CoA ligase
LLIFLQDNSLQGILLNFGVALLKMGKITIEHQVYSFEDIRNGNFAEEDPYYTHALNFCQAWLNGEDRFQLLTSGSTGTPKKIEVSRSQMEISSLATRNFFNIQANPTIFCCLNAQFVAGKMMLVRGLEWNASLHLTKASQLPFNDFTSSLSFDLVAMVPLQVMSSLEDAVGLKGLKQTKHLIIGGAPSTTTLMKKIHQEKIHAYQTYGMTETVSHVALAPIDGSELQYEALPGVRLGVDKDHRLWIEAPMAQESRIQTNDLAELISPTRFKWVGRSDFTINTGGIKVQPELLEKAIEKLMLEAIGKVSFFIGGLEDEKLGQKIILVIEKNHPLDDVQDLSKKLAEHLPKYHLPKEIHFLPVFVRTATGKINRTATLSAL